MNVRISYWVSILKAFKGVGLHLDGITQKVAAVTSLGQLRVRTKEKGVGCHVDGEHSKGVAVSFQGQLSHTV
jgi:hypothetical protein